MNKIGLECYVLSLRYAARQGGSILFLSWRCRRVRKGANAGGLFRDITTLIEALLSLASHV